MSSLLASCVGTGAVATGSVDPQIRQRGCDVAQLALKDPAAAARIVDDFGGPFDDTQAELAAEVVRNLSARDVQALARTPAGRGFLDTLETALASGSDDRAHQNPIETLNSARLAAASNATERSAELIRQSLPPGPSNGTAVGKGLAEEIKRDMASGSVLASAILGNPLQQHGYTLASSIAENLTNQELLTLAKTPAGKSLLEQMGRNLKMPYDMRTEPGTRVANALDPNADSYAHHVAQVQGDLYAKGLPVSAKGVQVFVIESMRDAGEREHAEAVKRTIAGENGLGRDADVVMRPASGYQDKYLAAHPGVGKMDRKDPSLQERAAYGVAALEANLYATGQEIKALRDAVPADGRTRIVNLSWGRDIASVATELAAQVKKDSPDWEVAVDLFRADYDRKPSTAEVRQFLAQQIADEMKKQLAEPANVKQRTQLQSALQQEVDAATRKGLLIFNAAGNGGKLGADLGDEKLATPVTDPVKGLVTVGAADLRRTPNPRDDAMWEKSAVGAGVDIAAPGVDMPVFATRGKPALGSGTSFAAPYAASVAALMVAANPKITPKQIEEILTSGRVTRDLPGQADGKGLLDPVKAVAEARKLAGR